MAAGVEREYWLAEEGEMLDRILATLSMKNWRKCSHVVWEVSGFEFAVGFSMVFIVSNRTLGL